MEAGHTLVMNDGMMISGNYPCTKFYWDIHRDSAWFS